MEVRVEFTNMRLSEAQRSYARRAAHFHLGAFGSEVSSVRLWLQPVSETDVRMGTRCRITVRGPNVHATRLDVSSSDATLAMDAAAEWAARAVRRMLVRDRVSHATAVVETDHTNAA